MSGSLCIGCAEWLSPDNETAERCWRCWCLATAASVRALPVGVRSELHVLRENVAAALERVALDEDDRDAASLVIEANKALIAALDADIRDAEAAKQAAGNLLREADRIINRLEDSQ